MNVVRPAETPVECAVPKVSVVIVSWNARDHLERCLASIRQHASDCVSETIVVDNASVDGSPEMVVERFPEVTLVRSRRNSGFAKANNLGLAKVREGYAALINSDVILHPDCLQRLVTCLAEHPRIALVGPRILGTDGRLQLTCRRLPSVWTTFCRLSGLDRMFPRSAWFSGLELPATRHESRAVVPALGGCFWVVRSEAIADIGGLDERFFFYAEDVDWCKRFAEGGWEVVFCPEATATHYGGGSSENAPLRYSIEIIRSTLKYWKKHHGTLGQALCFVMIFLHHAIRLVIRSLKRLVRIGQPSQTSQKIMEDLTCLRWLLTRREVHVE